MFYNHELNWTWSREHLKCPNKVCPFFIFPGKCRQSMQFKRFSLLFYSVLRHIKPNFAYKYITFRLYFFFGNQPAKYNISRIIYKVVDRASENIPQSFFLKDSKQKITFFSNLLRNHHRSEGCVFDSLNADHSSTIPYTKRHSLVHLSFSIISFLCTVEV